MTVLASEVKYTSLGETGIIDLVVRGPRGTCVVEVKTIGLKKAAWEAQMQRDPQGWYSTNKNRATAQARRYAQRGPYVHSKPYVLYVFPDCVTLVDVS
jgi:DNA-binding sugar fermentation-stimulating protein